MDQVQDINNLESNPKNEYNERCKHCGFLLVNHKFGSSNCPEITIEKESAQNYKVVESNESVIIFEGGWWMYKHQWNLIKAHDLQRIGFDKNERTHELTYYHLPV